MDELTDVVDELLEYFQLDNEQFPSIAVYYKNQYVTAIITDELYGILLALKEAKEGL